MRTIGNLHEVTESDLKEIMRLIRNRKMDPDHDLNNRGITPLHLMAFHSKEYYFCELLDLGANIYHKDYFNRTVLMSAAWGGSYGITRRILEETLGLINNIDKMGETATMKAAWRNHVAVIKLLAEHGEDFDKKDKYKETALVKAVWNNKFESSKYLLEIGANPYVNVKGKNLVMIAAWNGNNEMINLLIKYGLNINRGDYLDETALSKAVINGKLDTVKYLVEKGADINKKDIYCRTPLLKAIGNNLNEIAYYLIEKGAEISATDQAGEGAMSTAIRKENIEMVKYLNMKGLSLDEVNKKGYNLMHIASSGNNVEVLKYVLENSKLDINSTNYLGETPLHLAAKNSNIKIAELLLDYGADPNIPNKHNNTPIYVAIKIGHEETALKLLEKIDLNKINFQNKRNNGYLDIGVFKRSNKVIKKLLELGADPNICGYQNTTPIFNAVKDGNMYAIKLLVKYGAKVNIKANGKHLIFIAVREDNEDIIEFLYNHGANIEEIGNKNITPLYAAVLGRKHRAAKKLIELGAKINVRDEHNSTPLMAAVNVRDYSLVKLLIDNGADINANDDFKNTALIKAVHANSGLEIIKELIKNGANINAQDIHGKTALIIAVRNKQYDTARYLISMGADIKIRDKFKMNVNSYLMKNNDGIGMIDLIG